MNHTITNKESYLTSIFSKISFIVVSLFFLVSCNVKEIEVEDIQSFKILNITKNYILIDLTMPVKNDNDFSFKISKVDLEVTVNKINLGKIYEIKPINIKKKSHEIHHFIFKLKLEKIDGGGMLLIPSLLTNKVKIGVKGYVKANKFPFFKKVKIDYNKTTPIIK